jgi:PAS domain S-box-containing protein
MDVDGDGMDDLDVDVPDDDKEVKRQRHNEAELRRRQRIKTQIQRLQSLLADDTPHPQSPHPPNDNTSAAAFTKDQYSVLEEAAGLLERQTQWLEMLKLQYRRKADASVTSQLSAADFAQLFLNSPVGTAVISISGKFIDCNPAFEKDLGYKRGEIKNKTVFDLTPDYLMAKLYEVMRKLLTREVEAVSMAKDCVLKDSKICQFQTTVFTVSNPSAPDQVKYICAFAQPIQACEAEGTIRIKTV